MFPIRDHNPSGRTPYVVYALIAANIAVFLSYAGIMSDDRALSQFFFDYAIIPARISSGSGYGTLISSIFVHGGFLHLAGNMLFLWIFGDNLEDEMGHVKFLGFYLACGIGAGVIHILAAPGSAVPTVGASGAIAGVMGGYLLLFPKARIDILLILIVIFRVFPIPAWIMLAMWFIMQFAGGLSADPNAGGVAYWAHAGGFVAGFVLTIPLWLRLGGPNFWARTQGRPPHPETDYRFSPSNIPRIPRK
jgi:membrane associated rhomboid family serine protease